MISEKAKEILESNIGLSLDQIWELSDNESRSFIETKIGKPLIFSKKYDLRKIGRGNPLLARKKITTIDEINAKIDALHK